MLQFEPEKHEYFWHGKKIPSITQILKKTGLSRDYTYINDFYRERGTAVHKAIQLYLKDALDVETLDPEIIPYFEAFVDFYQTIRADSK